MNQAAKDGELCEKGYKCSRIRIQCKALSTFRSFLSGVAVACPPLSSETPDGGYSLEKKHGTLHWLDCGGSQEPQTTILE